MYVKPLLSQSQTTTDNNIATPLRAEKAITSFKCIYSISYQLEQLSCQLEQLIWLGIT